MGYKGKKLRNSSLKVFLLLSFGLLNFWGANAQNNATALPSGIYQEKKGSLLIVVNERTKDTLHLDSDAVCNIQDFEGVSLDISKLTGQPELRIILTEAGKDKFFVASQNNIGKYLAVIINGKLFSAPRVETAINTRKISIQGLRFFAESKKMKEILSNEIKENKSIAPVNIEPSDKIAIMSASESLLQALVNVDTVTLKRLVHEKGHYETYFGKELNKESLLRFIEMHFLRYTGFTESVTNETNITIESNTASLNKIINLEGIYKGGKFKARLNIWEVWVKNQGAWQLFLRTGRKIE